MTPRFLFFGFSFCFFAFGGCKTQPLATVPELDLTRYAGRWYEIARLPNRFEDGLKCIIAEYGLREDGKVSVTNRGIQVDDTQEVSESTGYAKVPDAQVPGVLKVTFFWPFFGDYYVIDLDTDYQWSLVGSPDRDYLWILSRNQTLDQAVIDRLLKKAQSEGFDTTRLIYTPHDCK